MTNFEKYRNEMIKLLVDTQDERNFCTKFVLPTVLKSMNLECTGRDCTDCSMLFSIWLMDEYKEPKPEEPVLKPCPFCGGKAKVVGMGWGCDYVAKCGACSVETMLCETKEEAIEAWNRRIKE